MVDKREPSPLATGVAERLLFVPGYWAVLLLFAACAIGLILLAISELWTGAVADGSNAERFSSVLQAIGLLTVAVASLELSQTILEEEIRRHMHISAPTRVRRFVSRFLVVVVVALSIETLVLVFELAHVDPSALPSAAAVGAAVGIILAGWGVFIHFNKSAEQLEPEAMEQAKEEDKHV